MLSNRSMVSWCCLFYAFPVVNMVSELFEQRLHSCSVA